MRYTYVMRADGYDFVFPEDHDTLITAINSFDVKAWFSFPVDECDNKNREATFALLRARLLFKYKAILEAVEWGIGTKPAPEKAIFIENKSSRGKSPKIKRPKNQSRVPAKQKEKNWDILIPGVDFDEELSPTLAARHRGNGKLEQKKELARKLLEGLINLRDSGLTSSEAVRSIAKEYGRTTETVRCVNVGDTWKELRAEYGLKDKEHII